MPSELPKDKIGQEVAVGDIIVYGYTLGQSAALRLGKVVKLTPVDDKWHARVVGVEDYNDWNGELPHLARPGTLWYPDRWLKLAPEMVPAEYMNLLKEVK